MTNRAKTPLQLLYDDWRDCQRCHLASVRKNVCVIRGTVPSDVLFVGEAPAHSEDVFGIPMIGPAGHLLNDILSEAMPEGVSYAITNICGCIPLGEDGRKVTKPDDVAVQKCSPRLVELVQLCQPKLIVCLGEVAQHYLMTGKYVKLDLGWDGPMEHVSHPSAIGRANLAQQGLLYQKTVVRVRNAVEEHVLNQS